MLWVQEARSVEDVKKILDSPSYRYEVYRVDMLGFSLPGYLVLVKPSDADYDIMDVISSFVSRAYKVEVRRRVFSVTSSPLDLRDPGDEE